MNITLIGMPGAGKSTIGVVLAKMLGYKFIDSDILIQEKAGKLLHVMISQMGRESFIAYENDINAGVEISNTVFATGGSAVYGETAMKHLRNISLVIYIKLSYTAIAERLGNLEERGVVLDKDETLLDLYNARCVLYEKYAHTIIDAENKKIKEVAAEIKKICNEGRII